MPLQHVAAPQLVAYLPGDRHQFAKVAAHGFESPALAGAFGRPHAQTEGGERAAVGGIDAHHRNPVHGTRAAAVAAQRDDDVVAVRVAALRRVVRAREVESGVFQQPVRRIGSVQRTEDLRDVSGVMHEAIASDVALAFACHERQRGQAIAQRGQRFICARLILGAMGADDPQRVRVLMDRALLECDHGPRLAGGIDLRGADAKANAFLVHQIQEMRLRSLAKHIAREMRVFRRAPDDPARSQVQVHHAPAAVAREALRDSCRSQIAATIAGQYVIAGHDGLDGLLRPVGHGHGGSRGQALIVIAHHERRTLAADQQPYPRARRPRN